MKYVLLLSGLFVFFTAVSGEIPPEKLILKGGARLEKGILKLDGKSAYALIPGTEDCNIGKSGLTLACSVRLSNVALDRKNPQGFDMFFAKGKQPFIFGRYGGQLYSNIRNTENKYCAPVYSSNLPETGVWCHMAIVYESYDNTAQGDVGYTSTIYVNGNPSGRDKHAWLKPMQNRELLDVGKGWGGVWFLDGDIAEVFVERRALNEAEITALADKSKYVKQAAARKVNPALNGCKAVSPAGSWLLQSLHAAPDTAGTRIASELKKAFQEKNDNAVIRAFGKSRHGIALYAGKEILVLLNVSAGTGSPVLGIYDRKAQRPALEDKFFGWTLKALRGKKKELIASSGLQYRVSGWDGKRFKTVWQSGKLSAESVFELADASVSADLKVNNGDAGLLIDNVVFPEVRFARAGKDDVLLYPYQCGALVPNPTKNSFKYGQTGIYPGQSMTMQFSAYYGGGRGVFLGWTDPHGTSKIFNAYGKRGGVEKQWEQTAAYSFEQKNGGNSYASPGKVVLELYSGEWFEACRIHRRFMRNADWFIRKLPRTDSPEWFRNAPITFDGSAVNREISMTRVAQINFLRNYFEVPLFVSLYAWDDPAKGGWPLFQPRDFTPSYIANILRSGSYVEPYTDARLWDILDGPGRKNDWRYSSHGKKYAVKLTDGSIPMEHYTRSSYAVMCPAASGWQEELMELFRRVAKMGSSAIYHDQVATARSFPCCDPTHGHQLNDPAYWLNQGYRPLYKKIRATLPGIPHTTEEISEPYIDLFDGGHIWRWTFNNQVPAFQAVYGGAVQYACLVYDTHGKGEYASNFVKMANSLVNGLKIGKFLANELYHADAKRLFAKKMTHLRLALNPYFNGGEMMKPVVYAKPVPLKTTGWSTSNKANELVTMPVVVSNSYVLNGTKVYIFVNTTDKAQTVEPLGIRGSLCLEGAGQPTPFKGLIKLPPYASAVIVDGSANEAGRIQKTLRKIAAFTPGGSFDALVRFDDLKKIRAVKGKWLTPADASGFYNLSKSVSGKYFGNTQDGSLISYGVVDFGKEKVSEIQVRIAVPEQYAGATFELLAGTSQNDCRPVGVFTVPATKSWLDFREFKFSLKQPLTGERYMMIRFNRNGCCNFSGWRF